ncbi:TetR/AcrR family transcriptional regulator [Antrihabitans cavernicola]|uniref:TetR/AcrR family transcriptional regulator n=1 Tax=Antrihabitans cavernicola TaxID=2495913 RepID=A0A5A7SCV0_9NOCA|nr:TetR family transcriptional regulator [Spelaeibacter cavernicola]KAA0023980.1 TetR/AcrR family transcriptional regulator [Spelaeibacter cavernicola]
MKLTAIHARDTVSGMDRVAPRVPYAEASRTLLRSSILDSMRDLLIERDWSKITLSDVSKRAGVSRQTLYNEFGSRAALAQAYALRLVDDFVDHVDKAVWANVGDVRSALAEAFRAFFLDSASEPLIQSLLSGDAKPDLLRLITLDSAPLVSRASARLEITFRKSWVDAPPAESGILARAVVRLAMSFISIPPTSDHDVAHELAALLSPFVEAFVSQS